jgi:DNA-directed RNA polymerase subunit M/transcription elongation factor TFIIS
MGAGKVFKNLNGKIKTNSEIANNNKEVKAEQKVIVEQYQLMGEKVFDLYKQGADVGRFFEEHCIEITKRLEAIAAHQQQISTLKGEVTCPKCGLKQQNKVSFCSKCGQSLGQ